jgi:acetate---CoA ligase (ADP-forming)
MSASPKSLAIPKTLADKILRPRRIAIVGASGDLKKNNSRPQRFLRKHGYTGDLYPINPREKELFGEACYARLADTPEVPDHALIMIGAGNVEGMIRECGQRGIAAATIFAGGFAESGHDGQERQRRLIKAAKEAGVRLIGPNSLGIISSTVPMTLCASAALENITLRKGRTAVISQSGSLIGALVSRGEARGIGFSTLVSVGNESDLSVGELGQMLIEDSETDVLVLFLETLRNQAHVDELARVAHKIGKPVMTYVLGRSDLGRTLAQSHTGAMIGQAGVLDAYVAARGFVRVNLFESLFEAPQLLAGRQPIARPPGPRRVALATTTGGGAGLVADHLGERGIEVVVPTGKLIAELAAHGLDIQPSPIVDLTMAGTREAIVDTIMRNFLADDRVDAIIMVVGSTAQSYPELVVKPLAKWAKSGKPIVTFLFPDAMPSLKLLAEAGIPGFRTPEACADAVAGYLTWQPLREAKPDPLTTDSRNRIEAIVTAKKSDEQSALGLFASLGIPVPRMLHMKNATDPVSGVCFPVVAKILSADIAHKSEVGGVRLGIADAKALGQAAAELLRDVPAKAPGAKIDGVLVQEQSRGIGEAIVGYRQDPLAGPVVVVGMGGILAEVYRDIAIRPAPVDLAQAHEMIAQVKGFAPLRGFRGMPKGDLDALAQIVVALSRLAQAAPLIAEAEINPVIVKSAGEGVIAVDGLVIAQFNTEL